MKFNIYFIFSLIFLLNNANAENLTYSQAAAIVSTGAKALDGRRADLFEPDSSIQNAVVDALSIPGDLDQLEEGIFFLSGCRPHSCDEKAAAVIDAKNKKVIAVAVKNFGCHYLVLGTAQTTERVPGSAKISCEREASNNIYIIREGKSSASSLFEEKAVLQLQTWGNKVGASKSSVYVARKQ